MITPSDTPSAPGEYDAVPVQGMDIQAPQEDLAAMVQAATSLAGRGGPRQQEAETLLSGADSAHVTAGYSGGGGEDWPSDVQPRG